MLVNAEGICRSCGEPGKGEHFDRWVKEGFNDRDKLQAGGIVCTACLFCFSDKNETLRERLSKEKPQRMRNYSHFVVRSDWIPLSKGDKRQMRQVLLASPSVTVIALSGQKHIIFRARLGWWQIEEQAVRPFPELLERLCAPVEALYSAGASKGEIESGRYSQQTVIKIGLDYWQSVESKLKRYRGGLPLQLAVFLAQKENHGTRPVSN